MNTVTKYLPYMLRLQAPAIVTTLSGGPNSVSTQAFIPGSAIRGALATKLLSDSGSAESDEFRELILGGRIRYLHAYPTEGSNSGTRSLPTPLPWRREKGSNNNNVINLAAFTGAIEGMAFEVDEDGLLAVEPEETWPVKPLDQNLPAFIAFRGTDRIGLCPRTNTRVHQQRDREKGRSWKRELDNGQEDINGTIFTYEHLEAEQTFRGIIQITTDSMEEATELGQRIKDLFQERTILVGRSRRAGYGGLAEISFKQDEQHEASWNDVQTDDIAAGTSFCVYLLSACILRDVFTGQIDPCALPSELMECLGGEAVIDTESILTFWDFEHLGGFNRKWQLEVPQALAVKAGSVLVLTAKSAVPANTLRRIEHEGIGERRTEGFGRLVFLRKPVRLENVKDRSNVDDVVEETVTSPLPKLVPFIQRRVLDAAINREIDSHVLDLTRGAIYVPTGSLLGRLRIPLREADSEAALNTLLQWLGEPNPANRIALKEEAQKKLRNCKLKGGQSLLDWLKKHVTPESGARVADAELRRKHRLIDDRLLITIAEKRGARYAVQLIDAVLASLARKTRTEAKEQPNE